MQSAVMFRLRVFWKFLTSVMVSRVVNSEHHPYFFQQGLQSNTTGYTEALETVVKPYIDLYIHTKYTNIYKAYSS